MSSALVNRLKSPWVLLLFAAGLAALVAYIAYVYLQQREQRIKEEVAARSSRQQAPKIAVVVPREDARIGVVVDQGLFVAREIDQDLVYPDTVLADDFSTVQGQRLARPVLRGRPLRVTDLQAPEIHDVATVLPAGMRAVTIDIDSVNSIAQTLRPGHRVDVFLMSKANRPRDVEVPDQQLNQATLFMQNLAVLATGQEFQDIANGQASERVTKMVRPGEVDGASTKDFDTITVLVTPNEAARLLVGQKMGTFRVALRGKQDTTPIAMRTMTGNDVLPVSTGRMGGVEMIVGGKNSGGGAIAPTLMPMGPPIVNMPAPQQARAGDVRASVENLMRDMTTPRRLTDSGSLPATK